MASLLNGFRRDTLPQIIEALQNLQDDPDRLAQDRRQYSDSPPPYPSGETTKPPSPAPILSEADRRIQRQHDRDQSGPYYQYMYQWRREEERIIQQIQRRRERRGETLPYNHKLDLATNAKNNIKNNWIEQGIWNDKWIGYPFGRWKHEVPPEDETEWQLEELRRPSKISGEQLAIREREAAASRPLPQFQYQISKEREWLEDEFWHEEFTGLVNLDTMAYDNIKNSWIEQKIWNPRWGEEPGMAWMHEEPDEDDLDVPAALEAVSTNQNNFADDAQQALRPIFGQTAFGLSSSQGSDDANRVSSHHPAASRWSEISSPFNQHEAASRPPGVDGGTIQAPTEPAAPILRKARSSGIKKRKRTKRPTVKASSSAMGHVSAGVEPSVLPTMYMPTTPRMVTSTTEVSLGASKPVRRKRVSEEGSDAQEPPLLLPRRSARIEARSGTSKCTAYDKDNGYVFKEGIRRAQKRSSRLERRTNLDKSADPRKPRGVLKDCSKRPVAQSGPSWRDRRRQKQN